MPDNDAFYAPGHRAKPRVPRPGKRLWTVRDTDMIRWSCELRDHGQHGVEAQILRNEEFSMSWRFPTRDGADAWAETKRRHLKTGRYIEDFRLSVRALSSSVTAFHTELF